MRLESHAAPRPLTRLRGYEVCSQCSFYCDRDSALGDCPRCRASLLPTCECGAMIEDPHDENCVLCGLELFVV